MPLDTVVFTMVLFEQKHTTVNTSIFIDRATKEIQFHAIQ